MIRYRKLGLTVSGGEILQYKLEILYVRRTAEN